MPRENLVGQIGEGWRIAMTVLAYERGAMSLAASAKFGRDLAALAAACKEHGRTGASVREKLARLLVENEVMRANGIRALANFAEGNAPGTESSIEKIYWSEFDKRFRDTALDLLGPGGQLSRTSPEARGDVDWAREFLWSRAGHDLLRLLRDPTQHHLQAGAEPAAGRPMKFALSDDQALLRSSTRDFLSSEFSLEKSRNVMEHSNDGYDRRRVAAPRRDGLPRARAAGARGRPGARRHRARHRAGGDGTSLCSRPVPRCRPRRVVADGGGKAGSAGARRRRRPEDRDDRASRRAVRRIRRYAARREGSSAFAAPSISSLSPPRRMRSRS